MATIIFLPGGGGSCLESSGGDLIWPPTIEEFITNYSRLPQLLDPGLAPTEILSSIPPDQLFSWPVYGPIVEDLQSLAHANGLNFIPFPYDFRKSVFDSAALLQAQIEDCYDNGDGPVTLICHSTGNQVARAVLENTAWQTEAWFGCIKRYVGICGPHFGVPEVLEYGLGLSDWLSIAAADMKTLTRDHRYPGCYQLFPFANFTAVVDVNTGTDNVYDPTVSARLGLDDQNLGAALSLQQRLQFQNKPGHVAYDLVAVYGQMTDEIIRYDGSAFVDVENKDDGDDTVPLWSAAPANVNTTMINGDHMGVLNSYQLRNFLHQLLIGKSAPFLVGGLSLSVNRMVYARGEPMSVLVIPDRPAEEISGTLTIEIAGDAGAFKTYSERPLSYSGPEVRSIRAEMPAPDKPGVYRMRFDGKTLATVPQTVAGFAVSPTSVRATRRRPLR